MLTNMIFFPFLIFLLLQLQLSWNFNYIDAGAALNVDLCANPDLVASDEVVSWGTGMCRDKSSFCSYFSNTKTTRLLFTIFNLLFVPLPSYPFLDGEYRKRGNDKSRWRDSGS
mmetsp:Transcript_36733/g.77085  ORF Transcript_36733/g.77085 Transcript_36733/m.77085 type:complete len:113 (+) Transcript_36733:16-354(+)